MEFQHNNFYYLQLMTITLNEFGQFMLEFVNKNFVPYMQAGTKQHQKSLQRWREVADIIKDIQKIHFWNLQSCLQNLDCKGLTNNDKEARQFRKNQNSRPNPISYGTQYNFYEKKQALPSSYAIQEQMTGNNGPKGNKQGSQPRSKYKYTDQYETKLSFQSKPVKQKNESVNDPEGFQKLIQSFRKLCTNFQNNHKKLLKEDQNYKENYKEETIEH